MFEFLNRPHWSEVVALAFWAFLIVLAITTNTNHGAAATVFWSVYAVAMVFTFIVPLTYFRWNKRKQNPGSPQ
jgi:hypothetical protein